VTTVTTARLYCDTTVLLIAAGATADPATISACRSLVQACAKRSVAGEISTEVLQELLHTAAWQQTRQHSLELVELATRIFAHPLPVSRTTVLDAVGLLREYPQLNTRVALHAAVMRAAGLGEVVSTDSEFGLISGIRRSSPEDAVRTFRLS
jgi:predicted nucleic acid-binding protein